MGHYDYSYWFCSILAWWFEQEYIVGHDLSGGFHQDAHSSGSPRHSPIRTYHLECRTTLGPATRMAIHVSWTRCDGRPGLSRQRNHLSRLRTHPLTNYQILTCKLTGTAPDVCCKKSDSISTEYAHYLGPTESVNIRTIPPDVLPLDAGFANRNVS